MSNRNKTIKTTLSDGEQYLSKCLTNTSAQVSVDNILDKTINGDTFEICPFLPPNSFDLIIADPPYNLTKDYNGTKFSRKSEEEYAEYTNKWLSLVKPLLKENGSIYVCCDWKSSLIIGKALSEFFVVKNRIT